MLAIRQLAELKVSEKESFIQYQLLRKHFISWIRHLAVIDWFVVQRRYQGTKPEKGLLSDKRLGNADTDIFLNQLFPPLITQ